MDYKKELNSDQYKAVTSESQFLRIIAGAGSGKTRVLTYRIAYLIDKFNVNPRNILAITFTNKVANEMKDRTAKLLGGVDLSGLSISTYHSWCARFLRNEITALGFPRNFTIIDDDDQLVLIKNIGESFGYKRGDEQNKKALKYIATQKCFGRLPSDCGNGEFGHEEDLKYFIEYERRKNEMHQLDFDDLLIYSIKILENYPDIREKVLRRYDHILIDEFQDTNDTQFKLLCLLTNEKTNVYVVGDPDQTIYTWRGANQNIILDFDRKYIPTETIYLTRNYRSTSNILNAANKLISYNKNRLKKDLYTESEDGDKVELKSFADGYSEARFIVNRIKEERFKNKDLKYRDFAVLYRSSYLTQKIENVLVTERVPYKIFGSLKFYQRAEIKDCIAYFKILVNEDDDISFERIVNVPRRKIGDTTVMRIKNEARNANLSIIKYLKEIHKHNSEIKSSTIIVLDELVKKLDETKQKLTSNFEAYSEVLRKFLTDIKYLEYLENIDDDVERVENVNSLLTDIRTYLKQHPESNFTEYLQNITLLSSQDDIDDSDNVLLMTAHTAKGLEFKKVFIMCFSDGVFPNSRSFEGLRDGLEEERRLAYVACTRAKENLVISYNKDFSYSNQSELLPSRFIKEMALEVQDTFTNPDFKSGYNNDGKYYYDLNQMNSHPFGKDPGTTSSMTIMKNHIKWSVGDICIHQTFGRGVVLKVEDEFITVNFDDFGEKQLLGSHYKLSKGEK